MAEFAALTLPNQPMVCNVVGRSQREKCIIISDSASGCYELNQSLETGAKQKIYYRIDEHV